MKYDKKEIKVYNKRNELIAVFNNNTNISGEARKDLMVNPTIDIVSNGASTLSFEMLAKSRKWQDIKNPENIYECNGRFYTALNENSIVFEEDKVEVTLVETWYLLKKVFLQAHNVNTKVEAIDEHTVKILPKTDKSFKLTVNGIVYDDSQVKDSRGAIMPRGSAGYALWAILKGTDWNLGICDILPDGFDVATDYGTFNVETDMKSALENIQFIQELYGGILDWDSKNKLLNLRDETKENSDFNKWKGFTIRKEKNLAEPPIITWDNNIITRLYPLGNGNLNIKKVNGGKGYVENFSYTDKVYTKYIQNPNIYDTKDEGGQKTLKYWAEKELAKICRPRETVTYNIVDLRATKGFEHETFDINDVVKAYYDDSNSNEQVIKYLRIQHLNYNYFFPASQSAVEVGDKIQNQIELFHQIYKKQNNSAQTDQNGHLSGDDVWVDMPAGWYEDYSETSLNQYLELIVQHETETTNAIAGLRAYADETFATITTFTEFQKQTDDNFVKSNTSITQISNELEAQIKLEASHYSETSQSIINTNATIEQTASSLGSQISAKASYTYVDNEIGTVNSNVAEIKLQANANGSQIELIADKVKVQGELIASKASVSSLNAVSAKIDNLDIANLKYNGRSANWKTISIFSPGSTTQSITYVRNVDFAKNDVIFETVSVYTVGTGGGTVSFVAMGS